MSLKKLSKGKLVFGFVVLLWAGGVQASSWLHAMFVNKHSYVPLMDYLPKGERRANYVELENPYIPAADHFYGFHSGLRSTDETHVVYPPVFRETWVSDKEAYVPEGPSTDSAGNAYYTHLFPFYGTKMNTLMVSLDADTGAKRWQYGPGQIGQGGAPLVLMHPVHGEVVYSGGAESIVALKAEDGSFLWETPTEISISTNYTDREGNLVHVDNKADGSMIPFSMKIAIDYHLWGLNYHPATDALVALYSDGSIRVFDRETGQLLKLSNGAFPKVGGARAKVNDDLPNDPSLVKYANEAFREGFIDIHPELSDDDVRGDFIENIVAAVLGGEAQISNYFSIDPNSDSVWLASTMSDDADGVVDGFADWGGLFRYDLSRHGNSIEFTEVCSQAFPGGSASTPTIRADGQRVFVADSFKSVLAIDRDCQIRWQVDIGDQAVGSLALSSVGNELYAATGNSVQKIQIKSDEAGVESATVSWEADLSDGFRAKGSLFNHLVASINSTFKREIPYQLDVGNLQISGIGDNGIVIQSALGVRLNESGATAAQMAPLVIATHLLDRETGAVLNSSVASEESISVITTASDGSVFIGNSPVRRAFLRGMLLKLREEAGLLKGGFVDQLIPPLSGGIAQFFAVNKLDLFSRDLVCSASSRLANAIDNYIDDGFSAGVKLDWLTTLALLSQAQSYIRLAEEGKEITGFTAKRLLQDLSQAESALSATDYLQAASLLDSSCRRLAWVF